MWLISASLSRYNSIHPIPFPLSNINACSLSKHSFLEFIRQDKRSCCFEWDVDRLTVNLLVHFILYICTYPYPYEQINCIGIHTFSGTETPTTFYELFYTYNRWNELSPFCWLPVDLIVLLFTHELGCSFTLSTSSRLCPVSLQVDPHPELIFYKAGLIRSNPCCSTSEIHNLYYK